MAGLKELAIELVGMDHAEDFAAWAFGDEFRNIAGMELFADAWNERHSEFHMIDLDSPIISDMIIMTDLWREHGRGI